MSLKEKWKDKVDGVDDVLAEDINDIAHQSIQNADNISTLNKSLNEEKENIENLQKQTDDLGSEISDLYNTTDGIHQNLQHLETEIVNVNTKIEETIPLIKLTTCEIEDEYWGYIEAAFVEEPDNPYHIKELYDGMVIDVVADQVMKLNGDEDSTAMLCLNDITRPIMCTSYEKSPDGEILVGLGWHEEIYNVESGTPLRLKFDAGAYSAGVWRATNINDYSYMYADKDLTNIDNEAFKAKAEKAGLSKNLFANAIKGEASGSVIRVDDVSPFEHEVDAKVSSTNILDITYDWTEKVEKGTTFKVNQDKSITVSGTPTSNTTIRLHTIDATPYIGKNIVIPMASTGAYCYVHLYYNDGSETSWSWLRSDRSTHLTKLVPRNARQIEISVSVLTSFDGNEYTLYPQINVGTVASGYSPYVDVGGVNVTKLGKNLIPYPYRYTTATINGITFTVNEDRSITVKGTATADARFLLQENAFYGSTMESGSKESATNGEYTISCKRTLYSAATNQVMIYIYSGTTIDETIYPQIEKGTTATEYEPYKEPTTYTPNADGTVEGVTSLAPTMTLIPDKAGVTLELGYNRDTNKVIESLINAIISLGGNI